jgi:uncharacterized protein (DUF1330 family)
MAGYILAQLEVTSATLYHRYRETLGPLVDRMGGRVLIDGSAVEILKGDSKPVRFLLIEFPSRNPPGCSTTCRSTSRSAHCAIRRPRALCGCWTAWTASSRRRRFFEAGARGSGHSAR